jgi:hypothetical protein
LSEICAQVFLPAPTPAGTLRRIAERNGVSTMAAPIAAMRYAHYYVGPIDAAEAFVREAKRAGFDARLLTG